MERFIVKEPQVLPHDIQKIDTYPRPSTSFVPVYKV
jgi:hypothetical protein